MGEAPGDPSLVFLERLNGKTRSRWEVPYAATGVPEVLEPLSRQNPRPGPGLWELHSFLGPSCDAPPWLHPTWGGIKVQTVVPLWAERHQGGGVAPGCKALAEEAWGGHTGFPRLRPSTAGRLGDTQLCPLGPWGWGSSL